MIATVITVFASPSDDVYGLRRRSICLPSLASVARATLVSKTSMPDVNTVPFDLGPEWEITEQAEAAAAATLAELAQAVDPAALFAAMAGHYLVVEVGSYSEDTLGDVVVRLELLAYHLYPAFEGPERRLPNASDISLCDDAVDVLCQAEISRLAKRGDITAGFQAEARMVRGSAYPDQLSEQIISLHGSWEAWFAHRCGIGPSRAVSALQALVLAHIPPSAALGCEGDAYADAHEAEHRSPGKRKPRWARITEENRGTGWVVAYSEYIAQHALMYLPTSPADLALEPPLTAEEWAGLIGMVGLNPAARAKMEDPADVRMRPLYLFPDGRVLVCDWANALDALWNAYEDAARAEQQFYDKYQKRRAKLLEEKTADCLNGLFPDASIFRSVSYPDPDHGDGATTELDLLIYWEPFLILVEAKSGQFRLKGRLGDRGRLRTDLRATVNDAAQQIDRALRYIQSTANATFRETLTGRTCTVQTSRLERTYGLVVTQQELAHLGARISEIREIGLLHGNVLPVSMAVAKLETVVRYSAGPEVFLHYLERRDAIQQGPYVVIADELNLFGAYLQNRLQLETPFHDKEAGPVHFLITKLSEQFDAEAMHRLGNAPPGPPIEFLVPPGIEELLLDLRSNPDRSGRRIAFEVLDLPLEALTAVAATLYRMRAASPPPFRIPRRASLQVGDTTLFVLGGVGLSPQELRDVLVSRALPEKHRGHTHKLLGLAVDLGAPAKPCRAAVWWGETWTSHPELDRAAIETMPVVPALGWKPPGRNEPCWCRSGKKHKHCCLHRLQN
jgi:hypothetical protein